MFSSFPYGKHCFQCQFLFSRCKLCLRYTVGNFNETPSMRARVSEHSFNFCEQLEQRPNLSSTFKLDGTIRYPFCYAVPVFVMLCVSVLGCACLCCAVPVFVTLYLSVLSCVCLCYTVPFRVGLCLSLLRCACLCYALPVFVTL